MTATLDRLRGMIPESARARIHAAVPPLFALLVAIGALTDVKAAALSGLALVLADMALSMLHSTSKPRTFLYPLAAAVASAAVAYGLAEEQTVALALAVLASVTGSATAARFTFARR